MSFKIKTFFPLVNSTAFFSSSLGQLVNFVMWFTRPSGSGWGFSSSPPHAPLSLTSVPHIVFPLDSSALLPPTSSIFYTHSVILQYPFFFLVHSYASFHSQLKLSFPEFLNSWTLRLNHVPSYISPRHSAFPPSVTFKHWNICSVFVFPTDSTLRTPPRWGWVFPPDCWIPSSQHGAGKSECSINIAFMNKCMHAWKTEPESCLLLKLPPNPGQMQILDSWDGVQGHMSDFRSQYWQQNITHPHYSPGPAHHWAN